MPRMKETMLCRRLVHYWIRDEQTDAKSRRHHPLACYWF